MKKTILTILLIASISAAHSQDVQPISFDQGTNSICLGVGFGGQYDSVKFSSQLPGLSLQYELGVGKSGSACLFGMGIYAGIKDYKYEYTGQNPRYAYDTTYTLTQKWNYTIVGVRGAIHFNGIRSSKIDLYSGVKVADNILKYDYTVSDKFIDVQKIKNKSYITVSAFLGCRYYISDAFGAFAELSSTVSNYNFGVALRF